MPISDKKQEALKAEMARLGIQEADLEEKFILGSGSGGQKINKSHSAVYLKHLPTQIEVKCQKDRSREANRFFARRALCEQMQGLRNEVTKKEVELMKIRKQKERRKRRAKKDSTEEGS
ncbi:MAG: peptide chain release factor-like protein [Simkaniaceae bacterium]|nr:peptide chain release factor-like protein [Simkaniaceae bacterium]